MERPLPETTIGAPAGAAARISAWTCRHQRKLSARVHAAGDEQARRHGWTVTEATGRFGFRARTYRHPASTTDVGDAPGGSLRGQPRVRPGDIVKDHLATAVGGTSDE
ncbi:MAG TPA: hypothetical protein VEF71_20425 [Streptosporangiaceae bacterium]|nr:hypothetical protein [Streptosporangiaceae bacterium]